MQRPDDFELTRIHGHLCARIDPGRPAGRRRRLGAPASSRARVASVHRDPHSEPIGLGAERCHGHQTKPVQVCPCADVWRCAQHFDQPWLHDDCAGPRIPCPRCQPEAYSPSDVR